MSVLVKRNHGMGPSKSARGLRRVAMDTGVCRVRIGVAVLVERRWRMNSPEEAGCIRSESCGGGHRGL